MTTARRPSGAGDRPAGRAQRPLVGVLGGTFNPIHVAHLRAAEEVAEALGIERMLFVPSASPPHKSSEGPDRIAPAELRLAWLLEAASDNPRFRVDPLEVERGGTSYSVDTLRDIASRTAPDRPVFVIGWDAFIEIDTWKDPATLFALADFAVMTRPPVSTASLRDFLPSCIQADARISEDGVFAEHGSTGGDRGSTGNDRGSTGGGRGSAGGWIRLVPVTPLDVSASDLRRRLREGRSVRYLLPERVHDAIVASGIYGPAAPRNLSQGSGDSSPEES